MRVGEKPQPVVFFEGADGTFKTTNALLFAGIFRYSEVFRRPVAYISLPFYQTPFGRLIGNFLGRWGDKIESLPPRETALLYALNRLEILPCVKKLLEANYLLVFNRSPYSNLYNLARELFEKKLDWDYLSREEKGKFVDDFLSFDQEFLQALTAEGRPVSKLFLHLGHEEAMAAVQRRADRDGRVVDLYERDQRLQEMVVRMYQDIAFGGVVGHDGKLVSICPSGRLVESTDVAVRDLYSNAYSVWQAFNRSLGRNPDYYQVEVLETIGESQMEARWASPTRGREVDFSLERILARNSWSFSNLQEARPDIWATVERDYPLVLRALEASIELDRTRGIGLGPEKRG